MKVNTLNQPAPRYRAAIVVLIALAVLYLIVGGIFALRGQMPIDVYGISSGIVGSLASILGLVSLSRPSLTSSDLKNLELDTLRQIADTGDEINRLEAERTAQISKLDETKEATEEEINALNQQKREMELLVQKASLKLFLGEQRKLYTKRIEEHLLEHEQLTESLSELADIDDRLRALNEQIETDPNVELLKSVIEASKRPIDSFEEFAGQLPPLPRAMLRMFREIFHSAKVIARVGSR